MSKTIIKTIPNLFNDAAHAHRVAAILNDDDPDFSYIVAVENNSKAYIEVYDENNNKLGCL